MTENTSTVMPVAPMSGFGNGGGFGFGGDGAWWLIVLFLFVFMGGWGNGWNGNGNGGGMNTALPFYSQSTIPDTAVEGTMTWHSAWSASSRAGTRWTADASSKCWMRWNPGTKTDSHFDYLTTLLTT